MAAAFLACRASTESQSGSPPGADAGGPGPSVDAAADGAAPVVELATGQTGPIRIVVDDEAVYWLNEPVASEPGGVMRLSKKGGVPTELHGTATLGSPIAMAQDARRLYVAANDWGGGSFQKLHYFEKDGNDAGAFQISADARLVDMVLAGADLVTARQANASVDGIVEASSTVNWGSWRQLFESKLGPVTSASRLAADATHLFVATNGAIVSIDLQGNIEPKEFETTNGIARAVVLESGALYWIDHAKLRRRDVDAPAGAVDLSPALDDARALAVHASYIYWTDGTTGTIWRASKVDGSGRIAIATGQGEPTAIAVDDAGAVFWTDRAGGAVRSVVVP